MFAIPMAIVVIMRRSAASTAWTTATGLETLPRSRTTEGGPGSVPGRPGWVTGAPGGGYPPTVNERVRVALELLPA
jgi:hypothetical protein